MNRRVWTVNPNERRQRRIAASAGLISLALLFLTGRLLYLQAVAGPSLAVQAFQQRARVTPLEPARGDIVDRNGESLTGTVSLYAVFAPAPAGGGLARMTGGLTGEQATRLGASRPGLLVARETTRYGGESLGHHLVGYVRGDDNRGVSGVELVMDAYLRPEGGPATGGAGGVLTFVDGRGSQIPGLGVRTTPAPPDLKDVYLTIDRTVQAIAERALARAAAPGAAVVLDAVTGDVLAMASRPDFAPDRVADSLGAADGPLVNRALAAYAPGSLFKLVVLTAALDTGAVSAGQVFECPGFVDIGRRRITCATHREGPVKVTLTEAVTSSCNTAFVRLGQAVGADAILARARAFGFGRTTPLGLPGEEAGVLPGGSGPLGPGDLANLSIGQGELTVTPVQMARVIAALAGGGVDPGLRVIDRVTDRRGVTVWRGSRLELQRVASASTSRFVRQALEKTVASGTARPAQPPGGRPVVAGKTGTAETPRLTPAGRPVNNAWFAGYFPADHPRWVVVVVIEGTGTGGALAAPVAAEIAKALAP
jgi:penicillin-binding protein 2